MSRPKREDLIRHFLAELPPDATEAERAVYIETQLGEHVTLVVSSAPLRGDPGGRNDPCRRPGDPETHG